jgi:hypothetical protein
VPFLKKLIVKELAQSLILANGVTISVAACSFRTTRGGTLVAVILDELAFVRSDESQNPDIEIIRSLKPALLTTRGPLVAISSRFWMQGVLYSAFRDHYGSGANCLKEEN